MWRPSAEAHARRTIAAYEEIEHVSIWKKGDGPDE